LARRLVRIFSFGRLRKRSRTPRPDGAASPCAARHRRHGPFVCSGTRRVCRLCPWRGSAPAGLARQPLQAKAFYAAIAAATFLGAMANVFALNPVTALVWAAVINGVVAVPVMALLMLMGANTKIMGEFTTPKLWNFVGWIATLMMAGATGVFVLTTLLH
jgi:hypothetical protein